MHRYWCIGFQDPKRRLRDLSRRVDGRDRFPPAAAALSAAACTAADGTPSVAARNSATVAAGSASAMTGRVTSRHGGRTSPPNCWPAPLPAPPGPASAHRRSRTVWTWHRSRQDQRRRTCHASGVWAASAQAGDVRKPPSGPQQVRILDDQAHVHVPNCPRSRPRTPGDPGRVVRCDSALGAVQPGDIG